MNVKKPIAKLSPKEMNLGTQSFNAKRTKKNTSPKKTKHKFKVGDIVGVKVYSIIFYGRVKKLLVKGAAEQAAYEITGFGDPVFEGDNMFKSRKKVL